MEPETIISGVSSAIKAMRDVDISSFPFAPPRWATEQGMNENIKHLVTSKTKHSKLHPDFANRTLQELRDIADCPPRKDTKVLSHGDLCMPNVLLDDKGTMLGFVDLGGLHIGNSQLDLAIMSWTVQANMGNLWANHLLAMHEASGDSQDIVYNRLAYDLGLERPDPWTWAQTPQLAEQRARLSA
jgi:aminoglycoside phosphotransferase